MTTEDVRRRMDGDYETPILREPEPDRPIPPWRPVDDGDDDGDQQ